MQKDKVIYGASVDFIEVPGFSRSFLKWTLNVKAKARFDVDAFRTFINTLGVNVEQQHVKCEVDQVAVSLIFHQPMEKFIEMRKVVNAFEDFVKENSCN